MRKQISIANLKRLPVGSDVLYVEESTGNYARKWIAKNHKGRLVLKGVLSERFLSEVTAVPGYHFEVER